MAVRSRAVFGHRSWRLELARGAGTARQRPEGESGPCIFVVVKCGRERADLEFYEQMAALIASANRHTEAI